MSVTKPRFFSMRAYIAAIEGLWDKGPTVSVLYVVEIVNLTNEMKCLMNIQVQLLNTSAVFSCGAVNCAVESGSKF